MNLKEIEMKIQELSDDLRREVLDFVEFLLEKYRGKELKAKGFKFNWEGDLSEIQEKFTSVELQHRALEWR
jgi:elongation factor P hydroxylase